MEIKIRETCFILLPEKALLRCDNSQLIVADIHLGKAAHFRKSGINFPDGGAGTDINLLTQLINLHCPKEVILLGDLFHSSINKEWLHIEKLLGDYPEIKFILVKGNHDILNYKKFQYSNFIITDEWEDESFIYSHKPVDREKFVLCGHLHPGVTITDQVSQSFRLPCFYLSENCMVLPAFGKLTGLQTIRKKNASEKMYVIYNSRISCL